MEIDTGRTWEINNYLHVVRVSNPDLEGGLPACEIHADRSAYVNLNTTFMYAPGPQRPPQVLGPRLIFISGGVVDMSAAFYFVSIGVLKK